SPLLEGDPGGPQRRERALHHGRARWRAGGGSGLDGRNGTPVRDGPAGAAGGSARLEHPEDVRHVDDGLSRRTRPAGAQLPRVTLRPRTAELPSIDDGLRCEGSRTVALPRTGPAG